MKAEIIAWDWEEQPDMERLDLAISRFEQPAILEVDTGSDQYAVVICERGTSQDYAQAVFNSWSNDWRLRRGGKTAIRLED